MYITMCEIDDQSSVHETAHSKPVHWDNPEGWSEEGCGRGGWDWGGTRTPWQIHVNVWQKLPQYCKVISLQL